MMDMKKKNNQNNQKDSHQSITPNSSSHALKKSKNLFKFVPIIIITKDNMWVSAALIGKNTFLIGKETKLKCDDYLHIICESKGDYYIEISFIKDIILHDNFKLFLENDKEDEYFDIVVLEKNLGKKYDEKRTSGLTKYVDKEMLEAFLMKFRIRPGIITIKYL